MICKGLYFQPYFLVFFIRSSNQYDLLSYLEKIPYEVKKEKGLNIIVPPSQVKDLINNNKIIQSIALKTKEPWHYFVMPNAHSIKTISNPKNNLENGLFANISLRINQTGYETPWQTIQLNYHPGTDNTPWTLENLYSIDYTKEHVCNNFYSIDGNYIYHTVLFDNRLMLK